VMQAWPMPGSGFLGLQGFQGFKTLTKLKS
jgi:hypothetical protein